MEEGTNPADFGSCTLMVQGSWWRVETFAEGFMKNVEKWRFHCTALSPKRRAALRGFAVGAGLSLVLIAAPLWLVSGATGGSDGRPGGELAPLAALSTTPATPAQFDISAILAGQWSGEMCPDDGKPIPVTFEFTSSDVGDIAYSLSVGGEFHSAGIVGRGACDVSGEDIAFHSFLAILNDCDEACGVDRLYQGHFDSGNLVGSYSDQVDTELCVSCVGGGTWWLAPEPVETAEG